MHMLPSVLILLINTILVAAQTRQQLSLNSVASFSTTSASSFVLPPEQSLSVSIATCSQSQNAPRFFISNSSSTANPSSTGGPGVYEIGLIDGGGVFQGPFTNGGVLAVEGSGSFEIGVSDTDPTHEILATLPFFGDTTANQALLFSPPFSPPEPLNPAYPNYTMLPVDIPQPLPPSLSPNFTLFISPTASIPGLRTACFLSQQQPIGNLNESLWLRDDDGWRVQWLLSGLTPSTNYTAFVIQDKTKISGPINFATKSAAFSCPLVANLPYCPRVAYAMPLAPPPNGDVLYNGDTLPQALSTPLRSYLTNFTTSLGSFACGRDLYSPLVGCIDCQREYRKWLCAISLPRCSEPSVGSPSSFTAIPAEPSAIGISVDKQKVFSALLPYQTSTPPRNQFLPQFSSSYQMLLPCIETCTSMDRACPPFLGVKCPTSDFNGAASYGIGYIDGADGDEGKGIAGSAQDSYGNVWCAAG